MKNQYKKEIKFSDKKLKNIKNVLVQSYILITFYSLVQYFQWKTEIKGPTNIFLIAVKVTTSYSTMLPGSGMQQLHIGPEGDTNRSIVVGIVSNRLQAGRPGFRILYRQEIFLFSKMFNSSLGPTQLPIESYRIGVFPGDKAFGA